MVLFGMIDSVGNELVPMVTSDLMGLPKNGFISILVMIVAVLGVAFLVAKVVIFAIRKANPAFKVLEPFTFTDGKWIVLGYALFSILNILFSKLVVSGSSSANQQAVESVFNTGTFGIVFMAVSAVIVAPILEELIFRGLIFNYLTPTIRWWGSCLLSGAVFAYIHVMVDFSFITFTPYFIIGTVLGFIYYKTGKIQYAIGAHMLSNAISVATLLLR
ncbi:CPBP family intramembrane glutamic endopeptidase [Weissella ceti]|nr:CPBP family intramembrane glutamic endopeptidase [Weissella ceti]